MDKIHEKRIADIIGRTYDQLFSVLYTLSKNRPLCEDIMQETYVRVWKNLDNIQDDEAIMALLKRYARNLFIDELRKVSRKETALSGWRVDVVGPSPEEMVIDLERNNEVQKAIDKLPKQQQLIFRLHKEQALSYRQIAEQMGIATGTIEKQMGRALKFLRSELGHLNNTNCSVTILLVYYMLS